MRSPCLAYTLSIEVNKNNDMTYRSNFGLKHNSIAVQISSKWSIL